MIVRLNLDLANRSEEFRIEFAEICEEPDVLSELSQDESTEVLIKVAENYFTKKEDQIKLANNPDTRVQCAVAENQRKYPEVINTLLKKSTVVKIYLAQNITDSDILDVLATDPDYRVRVEVAKNKHTRMQTLLKLAKDPEVFVRVTMAKWPETEPEIRRELAKDPDESVRQLIAGRNDNTAEDLHNMAINEKNLSVLKAIARSRIADGETLDELAKVSTDLWFYISENPNTLEHTLNILAKAQSIDVLIAVLKHKNTSDDTICELKKHQSKFIRNLAYYYAWFRRTR